MKDKKSYLYYVSYSCDRGIHACFVTFTSYISSPQDIRDLKQHIENEYHETNVVIMNWRELYKHTKIQNNERSENAQN